MDIREKVLRSTEITEFQRKVYLELLNVPAGETITYGELARRVGCRSARAVGGALNRNPFAPDVPCHRVISSDGTLGGYAFGLEKKKELLTRELQFVTYASDSRKYELIPVLYSLTSPLHGEKQKRPGEEQFIRGIEAAMGLNFRFKDGFEGYGSHLRELIYVRTGGTEGIFKSLDIKGYVTLLTSGESNSLAASMEILSYLRQRGQEGEILHGSPEEIAAAIVAPDRQRGEPAPGFVNGRGEPATVGESENPASGFVEEMRPVDLGGVRLGVIGRPSDWLISSGVEYAKAKERFNVELVDVPMAELVTEIRRHDVDLASFRGSEAVYESLKVIISRHRLGGLTLRCFDLLDSVHNTGCLALARLNAEGLPSSCEGDIPALISMAYLQKTKGCPGFQCNLSKIEGDNLLFAHCTVPLTMTSGWRYMTHFESGIGTAIKGELPAGPVEIFKISPDLEHCVRIPAVILRNESRPNLCRTQIVVSAPGAASYFLREPLANHHIVTYASDSRK